jgi:energy-coupling factor transporter ATP-binding protein EcfA2
MPRKIENTEIKKLNFDWQRTFSNAKILIEVLLRWEKDEFDCPELEEKIIVKWMDEYPNQLQVTGKVRRKKNQKEILEELGIKKEYLVQLIEKAGENIETPSNQKGHEYQKKEIQYIFDLLGDKYLKILDDKSTHKNQGYWKLILTLDDYDSSVEDNLKFFEDNWHQHSITKLQQNPSKQLIQFFADSIRDWHKICGEMLSKYKRLTTNELLSTDEEMKFKFDDIRVPLALLQRKKIERHQENISPEFGSQLLQPSEYEENQRFDHDDFLEKVLKKGVGRTQGKRIALIGEPGAGKTTLLQSIAFWILENNLGLPIWISLADLQQQDGSLKDFGEYLRESWLGKAISYLTPAIKAEFTKLFEFGQVESRQVWLLLDGVDEIAMENISPLQAISSQLQGWIAKSRVILTCRLNIWETHLNALEDFETFRLLDFDYPSQVKQFIDNWFKDKDKKLTPQASLQNPEKLSNKGEELWQELDKPENQRIQDLVKNPLRLALLCGTWQSSNKGLPDTKAGLYYLFVQHFYKWKSNRFPTKQKQQRQLNTALGNLAKQAIDEETSRFRLRHSFVSSVLGDGDDKNSLFWLALQLGWLNKVGIAAESDIQEEVYAFYHPTFQEYFAALAIDDWNFFLNHVPENPTQGSYRIFEKQWKQVILLWFGRDNVNNRHKEEFIKALVEFEDDYTNYNFYGKQAYFLAASAIAEFKTSTLADEIIDEIVNESLDDEDFKNAALETDLIKVKNQLISLIRNKNKDTSVKISAANILGKIEKDNDVAIDFLVDVIQKNLPNIRYCPEIFRDAIKTLGKICRLNSKVINKIIEFAMYSIKEIRTPAIFSLVEIISSSSMDIELPVRGIEYLINLTNNPASLVEAVWHLELLGKSHLISTDVMIDAIWKALRDSKYIIAADISRSLTIKNNPDAINFITKGIENGCPYEYVMCEVAFCLGLIDESNPIAVKTLLELAENAEDESVRIEAATCLKIIDKHNFTAVKIIIEFLENSYNQRIRLLALIRLRVIDNYHPMLINSMIDLICHHSNPLTSYTQSGYWYGITSLSDRLKSILQFDNMARTVTIFKNYLSNEKDKIYSEQAEVLYDLIWHCAQNMSYPDFYKAWYEGENKKILSDTLTLDNLKNAILKNPQLNQTIHLICIDTRQIIDTNNPIAEIYDQMLDCECPESEKIPETVTSLKLYYNSLKRKSNKRLVLVFYESQAKQEKLSDLFFMDISKFNGKICVICDEHKENFPLKLFTANQPMEDFLNWLEYQPV